MLLVRRGSPWAHPGTALVAQVSKTFCIADFQIGSALKFRRPLSLSRFADLEIRDTADLEVGVTGAVPGCAVSQQPR